MEDVEEIEEDWGPWYGEDLPRFCLDALREHLRRLLVEGNAGAETIFCTKTGYFISKSSFRRQVYEPLLRRAKVP